VLARRPDDPGAGAPCWRMVVDGATAVPRGRSGPEVLKTRIRLRFRPSADRRRGAQQSGS